jgi:hypothetical protein
LDELTFVIRIVPSRRARCSPRFLSPTSEQIRSMALERGEQPPTSSSCGSRPPDSRSLADRRDSTCLIRTGPQSRSMQTCSGQTLVRTRWGWITLGRVGGTLNPQSGVILAVSVYESMRDVAVRLGIANLVRTFKVVPARYAAATNQPAC